MAEAESIMQVDTEHFRFNINITTRDFRGSDISRHYQIGSDKKPCLSLNLFLPVAEEIFGKEKLKIATLTNIESLYECVSNESSQEYFELYSFSKELLGFVQDHLRKTYPYIQTIRLTDDSYIPCNRAFNDTLDLLTYSIAHYKATWYERSFNAYFTPAEAFSKYRQQIEVYGSSESKAKLDWDSFFNSIQITTPLAIQKFTENMKEYKKIYESSKTFPDFFRALTNTLQKSEKCQFYKEWLQQFIESYISSIQRSWTIDLYPRGGKRVLRKITRRKRKYYSSSSIRNLK
jgi:hypothetical protein